MKFLKNLKEDSKIEYVFLIILMLFSVYGSIENYRILNEDTTPFSYDIWDIYSISSYHYRLLETAKFTTFIDIYLNYYWKDYPPLITFQAFPFYLFFGLSEDSASFSNVIHIFILLFSTYFIGKKIKNKYVGFISSIILFFIPGFLGFSRTYLPVFALTSLVTLTITLFVYSNAFNNKKISAFFGLTAGLGMLTKPNFPIYIISIIFLLFTRNIQSKKRKAHFLTKNQVKNLFLSFIIFMFIISSWYPKNLLNTLKIYQSTNNIINEKGDNFINNIYINSKEWSYRLRSNNLYSDLFFVLIIIAFIYNTIKSFINRKSSKSENILISDLLLNIFIILVILLTLVPDIRHILPLIPLTAILCGNFLFDIYLIVSSRFKMNKLVFNIGLFAFIILIIFIGLINKNYIKNIELEKNEAQNLYKGIIIPNKNYIVHKNISQIINDSLHEINGSRILVLVDHDILYGIIRSYSRKYYQFDKPVFCLQRPDLINPYEECQINRLSLTEVCAYDLVIDSNLRLKKDIAGNLQSKYPERWQMMNKILSTWTQCKKKFILSHTIDNVPFDGNINTNIKLYVRRKNVQ